MLSRASELGSMSEDGRATHGLVLLFPLVHALHTFRDIATILHRRKHSPSTSRTASTS